jgi:hypothetical protein
MKISGKQTMGLKMLLAPGCFTHEKIIQKMCGRKHLEIEE